jgi:RNA polymerase sigma-70 factor (ECF subfamily)
MKLDKIYIFQMIEENKQLTDQELVKRSLESADNFATLLERYQAKLERYIRRISSLSQDEIQDLLQDIFIKVYINLNNYDNGLSFSSWIYRISHNHFIDYIRKEKKKMSISLDKHDLLLFLPDKENINKSIEDKDCWKNVTEIINQLPERYKDALILRFIEEKSYDEIMDILKKPKGSIATLIKRGKVLIEKELKRQDIIC